MSEVVNRIKRNVRLATAGLQITRIFPAVISVERMPRGRLDVLAVDGEVHDLVVVVDERVDTGVFFYLTGVFMVNSMVLVLWGTKNSPR